MKSLCSSLIAFIVFGFLSFSNTTAQLIQTPVNCGTIIENEFTQEFEQQIYSLSLNAGDKFIATVTALGETLNTDIVVLGPNDRLIAQAGYVYGESVLPIKNPMVEAPIVSATGDYLILIANTAMGYNKSISTSPSDRGGVGVYTLYIGCTLRDGTVINPGDTPPDAQPPPPPPSSSGNTIIIPDLTNAAKIPFPAGIAMSGAVAPTGEEILGYTLDAAANDVLDLTFTRLSGNLNLGLVVLSVENKIVFQASVITSSTLNTRLTLPTAGTYTIGVYRVDLLPPAAPEVTAFQLQATLNP